MLYDKNHSANGLVVVVHRAGAYFLKAQSLNGFLLLIKAAYCAFDNRNLYFL